jgi:AraC-like DNA-binding protein
VTGLTALDLGLRGAASGVFLMMVLVLLRLRPLNRHVVLGIVMSVGGAAYAIATAPFIPKSTLWWTLPILSAQCVVLWLWARATFDDDFVLKRRHAAFWLAVVGLGFAVTLTWTTWPTFARNSGKLLSIVALVLVLAAGMQTVKTWRADLVARRRRLRIAVLAINIVFIGVVAGSAFTPAPITSLGASGSFASALSLFVLAMLAGYSVFGTDFTSPLTPVTAAVTSSNAGDALETDNPEAGKRAAIAPLLLRRLDNLMTVERIYRQEGLSIGALAARLDVPEHRLREAINEGLGYRNFNAFLNRYRIDEAKAALSDESQREVPVLTIAMDAGFQSIGPFNRAFKATTGMTPTEFRREALARATTKNETNREIGQSRQGFG